MAGYRHASRAAGGNAANNRYAAAVAAAGGTTVRRKSRRQVLEELYGLHNPDDWAETYLDMRFGDLVVELGFWTYHTDRSDRSDKGYPDETVLGGREPFWVELKTATGKVTPEQRDVIHRINVSGGLVRIYRPADWMCGRVADELRALRGRGRPAETWPVNLYRCGCNIAVVHTDGHRPECPIERTPYKTKAGNPGRPWWQVSSRA